MHVIASTFLVDDPSIVRGNAEAYPCGKAGSPEQVCILHRYYGSAGCEFALRTERDPSRFQGTSPFK